MDRKDPVQGIYQQLNTLYQTENREYLRAPLCPLQLSLDTFSSILFLANALSKGEGKNTACQVDPEHLGSSTF